MTLGLEGQREEGGPAGGPMNLEPLLVCKAGDTATEGVLKLPENLPKQAGKEVLQFIPFPVLQTSASTSLWPNLAES